MDQNQEEHISPFKSESIAQKKKYVNRSFSVSQKDFPTLILFDELVRRKGGVFSKEIVEAMRGHVQRNPIPKHQTDLTQFFGKPTQLCSNCKKNPAAFIDVSVQGEFPVCAQCHERHVKVGILKGWRKI